MTRSTTSVRPTAGRGVLPAVVTVAAALVLTACGTERGGDRPEAANARPSVTAAPSRTAGPSYPPRPTCARATDGPPAPSSSLPTRPPAASPTAPGTGADTAQEPPADAPPHYAENHAYRQQGSLSAEQRARGQASARLIVRELEKARKAARGEAPLGDARIVAALRALGCGTGHGVYVEQGFFSVHTGAACVSGRATEDGVTAGVHGAYAEPQPGTGPCVENRGGH